MSALRPWNAETFPAAGRPDAFPETVQAPQDAASHFSPLPLFGHFCKKEVSTKMAWSVIVSGVLA
ncbi:MAG TPA: hypothetical protein DDY78_00090 [Planctomycetales bacterium]|nr:hypothetical protein [Planctomycetales bacterium]